MTDPEESALDSSEVIRAITELVLGEQPHLTRAEVSELSGVDTDVARRRWKALGFPEVDDGDVAFTNADVEALRVTEELIGLGVIEPENEQAIIRSIGRSFARLADWQVRAFLGSLTTESEDEFAAGDLEALGQVIPLGERVQSHTWRRHLVNATTRMLLTESDDVDAIPQCVGFADIVGYTSLSRTMTRNELTAMVERFEEVTAGLITDHHGHVVKTIGDEVLFLVDEPRQAALLALALLDEHEADDDFPAVRIGMAYGKVLNHMGDVFGPVVNIASRLTSVARPASAVIDRAMADEVRDDDLRVKPMRRTSVKGYEHLQPWSLKRPRDQATD